MIVDNLLRANTGSIEVSVALLDRRCGLTITAPVAPDAEVLARVRTVMADLYGSASGIEVQSRAGTCMTTVRVDHEPA